MMSSPRRRMQSALLSGAALILVGGCGTVVAESQATTSPTTSATPSPRPPVYDEASTGPGDQAPHQKENNGWKRRRDLSLADKRAAEATAKQIRPALEQLRKAGNFTPASVLQAFEDLGLHRDRISVTPMSTPSWQPSATPVQGVIYVVRAGTIACVDGDIRPERVLVQVEGPDGEGNCIEPLTH